MSPPPPVTTTHFAVYGTVRREWLTFDGGRPDWTDKVNHAMFCDSAKTAREVWNLCGTGADVAIRRIDLTVYPVGAS